MLKFLKTTTKSFYGKLSNIALAYIINVVWALGIIKFYKWLFEAEYATTFQFFGGYKRPETIAFIGTVIMVPLVEEVLFRHLPLQIAKRKEELLLPIILFTSLVFGLAHDGGLWSVPIQGVGGFILACLYVKNGYNYWSSVALHALWNLSLTLGILNL